MEETTHTVLEIRAPGVVETLVALEPKTPPTPTAAETRQEITAPLAIPALALAEETILTVQGTPAQAVAETTRPIPMVAATPQEVMAPLATQALQTPMVQETLAQAEEETTRPIHMVVATPRAVMAPLETQGLQTPMAQETLEDLLVTTTPQIPALGTTRTIQPQANCWRRQVASSKTKGWSRKDRRSGLKLAMMITPVVILEALMALEITTTTTIKFSLRMIVRLLCLCGMGIGIST